MPCVFGQPERPCRGEFKSIDEPVCYPVEHILCEASLATQEEVSLYCDEGWSLFEGRGVCHKVFRERISSIEGVESFCESYSANISMILSEAENDFLRDLTMNGWYVNHLEFENRGWIGAKEIPGKEDEHQWNNGEKVNIHRIVKGRPSDSNACLTFHPRSLESRWRTLFGVFCDPWQYLRNKDVPQVLCEKPATDKQTVPATHAHSYNTKPCSDGWHSFPGSSRCHKLLQIGVSTMDGARRICQTKGGRLSSLRSKEELRFATGLMQLGWKMHRKNEIFYDHVWVALTKDETSGKWKWNGKEEMIDELGEVVPNGLITSNCAAFQPFYFLNGTENFFGEIPCDTDFRRLLTYPPSHILCERENEDSPMKFVDSSVECSENWHFHENSKMCIKLFAESTNSFQQAQNKCLSEGGNLISVNTDDKRAFVIGLKEHGWRLRKTDLSKSSMWVGLKKEGGTWKWLNGDLFDVSMFQSDDWEHNTNCGLMLPNDKVLESGKYGAVLDSKCELPIKIEHLVCEKDSFSKDFTKLYIIAGVSILFLLIVSLIIILFLVHLQKKKTEKQKQSVQDNIHLFASPPSSEDYYNVSNESLKLEDIQILKKIGSGKFGCVYLAEMLTDPPIKVAVKTCRIDGYQQHLNVLSSELTTLTKLPKHLNIVELLGSVTTDINRSGQIYIVLELCELGSIHFFLSKFQISNYVNELYKAKEENKHYYNTKDNDYVNSAKGCKSLIAGKLRTTDLLVFSEQIANGLCHLSENNCIHRDLATRNILLTSKFICTISDFGMARIVEPNYYNIETDDCSEMDAFPQRWMAPESLDKNVFSFSADVWSFGIVLFEIFSLSAIPYFKFSPNEVRNAILSGEINEQPEYCHDHIYDLMKKCWNIEASERPKIQECHDFLKQHLKEAFPTQSNYLNDDFYNEGIVLEEIRKRLKSTDYYNE